ncbi:hypothetical protein GP486_001583 [Trichoglossum hirsutum]|uniref:Uncharacterized protein n=1 Tax=Trichoglossum hirsutum TaxID=265104 RepID=A0A9P8LGL5_9PEZI|nr:hypothetical protein GP486_001583 [Trichoglossum hirsutum]
MPCGLLFNNIERLGLSRQSKIELNAEREFGPMVHEGSMQAGETTEAFIGIWRRDPKTGLAAQGGNRINLLPPAELPQLEFKLSGFINILPDRKIALTFKWNVFRALLKQSIEELAGDRYATAMKNLNKMNTKDGGSKEPENPPQDLSRPSSSRAPERERSGAPGRGSPREVMLREGENLLTGNLSTSMSTAHPKVSHTYSAQMSTATLPAWPRQSLRCNPWVAGGAGSRIPCNLWTYLRYLGGPIAYLKIKNYISSSLPN